MTQLPPPFEIRRADDDLPDGTVVLVLAGELDMAAVEAFRARLDARAERLVLDFSDVTFMDSSMLKELLRARADVATRGGEVVVVAPQRSVQRLLEVTRTGDLMRLVDDRDAALG